VQYNNKILEKIERNAKEFEEFNPWHYVSKNTNLIISQLIGFYIESSMRRSSTKLKRYVKLRIFQ
jgi:hypothetical protein